MKVLHLPRNPANVAWNISRAQRKLGYVSDLMVLESKKLNIGYDYNFHLEQYPLLLKYLIGGIKLTPFLMNAIRNYDIFHIHYKQILPFQLDTILFKKFNKKVIFHFHGCDIRLNCPHPSCQKNKWEKSNAN
ncbi:MAG: hypothetical protein QW156_01390 [Candidatus Aenigmatarchaeota archaeon]